MVKSLVVGGPKVGGSETVGVASHDSPGRCSWVEVGSRALPEVFIEQMLHRKVLYVGEFSLLCFFLMRKIFFWSTK